MTEPAKRIAVMLDLGAGFERHTKVFAGVLSFAQSRNWSVIINEYADDALTRCSRKDRPYDGIIARATKKLADGSRRLKLPVVNVWQNSPAHDRLPGVYPDFRLCGRLRAEHLLQRGLRQFGALTGRSIGHLLNLEGFTQTIHDAGHACATAHVSHSPSSSLRAWQQTERTIDRWIDQFELPIGIYVGEDEVARLVAQTCINRGLRIPEDVAIVAGINEVLICEGLSPTLTSMELGLQRIGHEAAMLLNRLMAGDPAPTKPLLLPPIGLVVRESTDFFAVGDTAVSGSLRFIADHSHRPIGPEDVARAVNVKLRTLQIRFRKSLGRPIASEIRRVRLERAKRELMYGEKSVAEIARTAGFGTPLGMYQVFKRELGLSPIEYRRQAQTA